MNRRRALAALGGAAATVAGYGALRVGDYRPYDPDTGLPDGSGNERVVAAARRLHTVDHRAVTRVRVTDDGTDADPYRTARYRVVAEHSRRRLLAAYTTFRLPPGDPDTAFHGIHAQLQRANAANADHLPLTSVHHRTDAAVVSDWDAPTPEAVDAPPSFSGEDVLHGTYAGDEPLSFGEYVLPHRAAWRLTSDDGGELTYVVDDPDAYARVPPLLTVESVHDGSRMAATLDAGTGLLTRLEDRRVATRAVGDDGDERRRFTYDIVTTFDRYGEATAPRPDGAPTPGPTEYASRLLADLRTY